MNILLIIATGLVLLTFIAHTFFGDKEYKRIEPTNNDPQARIDWTMGRGAFHIVSADFLLATLALFTILFEVFSKENATFLLKILALYFFCYGIGFLAAVLISKDVSKLIFRLPQWLLLFIIAALIYFGIK